MNCKSCNYNLTDNDKFCRNCGGKIITERLSLKGTWQEFIGPFFSWDNNFWRTFFDMFNNPKEVLSAYITGARKKYFQPFSYLILYATIAVFFYKFFPVEMPKDFSDFVANGNNVSISNKMLAADTSKLLEFMYSYYNFILILFLPFYALMSYLTFFKKGHNFSEHLVFSCYIQATFGFISLVLQLIICNFLGFNYIKYTYLLLIIFFLQNIYVFKSLYSLNFKQVIVASLKYILFAFTLYIVISIVSGFFFIAYLLLYK